MPNTASTSTRSVLIPLIASVLGSFMVILDSTVVNVALPTLGRVLNTDLSVLQWVISGYMLAQAAVLYRLTPPERRGAIFGLFGIPVMVAPALGPLLSGYLLEYADWRLIFLINLPVGVLALLIGLRVLPSIPPGRVAGALDWLGIVLGPLAFASLSFGVSESTTAGWTAASTLGGIGLGVLA